MQINENNSEQIASVRTRLHALKNNRIQDAIPTNGPIKNSVLLLLNNRYAEGAQAPPHY